MNEIICAGLLIASPCREEDRFAFGNFHRDQTKENWLLAKSLCETLDKNASAWESSGKINGWNVWRHDAQFCHRAWELLDDAYFFKGQNRIVALERLREHLGDRDYRLGRMPPPWPLWLFREIE